MSLQTREGALGTIARVEKGPLAPAPELAPPIGTVAAVVAGWHCVIATTHWHLSRRSQVDGIDFYVGDEELGHIHLDGSIHLATNPVLGKTLVRGTLARPFRYVNGWVEANVHSIGAEAAVALFRFNYERLAALSQLPSRP